MKIGNSDYVLSWKCKRLSAEIITPLTPNNFLNPLLNYLGTKKKVRFGGSCLKQDKFTNCNNINIMIDKMTGHFEEKSGNKYLVLNDLTKKVSKKYKEAWEGVKKEIETINGGKKLNMGKIF